jgi:hypothetical protein
MLPALLNDNINSETKPFELGLRHLTGELTPGGGSVNPQTLLVMVIGALYRKVPLCTLHFGDALPPQSPSRGAASSASTSAPFRGRGGSSSPRGRGYGIGSGSTILHNARSSSSGQQQENAATQQQLPTTEIIEVTVRLCDGTQVKLIVGSDFFALLSLSPS